MRRREGVRLLLWDPPLLLLGTGCPAASTDAAIPFQVPLLLIKNCGYWERADDLHRDEGLNALGCFWHACL